MKEINNFSFEDVETIIEFYALGNSLINISNKFNCHHETIRKVLIKYNIKCRNSGGHGNNRKIFFNQRFFDTIDTEAKAYFLGLLYADGCVHHNCVDLRLNDMDKDIIKIFANCVAYPIEKLSYFSDKCGSSICRLVLSSKYMKNSLIKHGCVPNKVHILKFPTTVPNHLLRHFCRGYFDGDGCISVLKSNNRRRISVAGTEAFVTKYSKIIFGLVGVVSTNIYHEGNLYNLIYNHQDRIQKIGHWFYQDSTIYLKRKYNRFLLNNKKLCQ